MDIAGGGGLRAYHLCGELAPDGEIVELRPDDAVKRMPEPRLAALAGTWSLSASAKKEPGKGQALFSIQALIF
jgi:hypothetical protein